MKLRKCPICKSNVTWESGKIKCKCGLSYRPHPNMDIREASKKWNNAMGKTKECQWKYFKPYWKCSCGFRQILFEANPEQADMKYCPKCGGKIEVEL